MSLLLDALNRASKEKAATGAAGLAPQATPQSRSEPELVISAPTQAPELSTVPDWPNMALTPEPEVKPAPPVVEELPSPPPSPESVVPPAEFIAKTPEPMASPPANPAPKPFKASPIDLPEPELSLASNSPAPDAVPPANAARPAPVTPTPGTQDPARVAQGIQRAKAPDATKRPAKRLIVLTGLAILVMASLLSVFSGWWGDPMAWVMAGSRSSLSPPVPMAVSGATAEPAPEPATAAASAPAAETPVAATSIVAAPVITDSVAAPPVVATPVLVASPSVQAKPPAPKSQIAAKPVVGSIAAPREKAMEPDAKPVQAPAAKAVPAKKEVATILSRSVGPSALELGYDALTQGRLKEASQAYTQALVGNPEERDALLGLAYIAHQQGRDEEATAYYKRVLRQEPGNAVAQAGLIALDTRGDPQDSASHVRDIAEQNPKSAAAQAMLGHSLVQENRLADAQQAFYRAHLLEPAVASHAFNLAVALDRMRNYASAQRYYEMALSLSAQSGGERASRVPHAAVQTRLDQLRRPTATDAQSTVSQ